ncbi:hypothetical protein [Anabaena sp. PCC 7108]|nr:hypothetical protein [Anabaena sp. PCC 7108]
MNDPSQSTVVDADGTELQGEGSCEVNQPIDESPPQEEEEGD